MRLFITLAMCLAIKAHGQMIITHDLITIRIGSNQITVSADSVNIQSVAGAGTRFVTATPNGRLSSVPVVGSGYLPITGTVSFPAASFLSSSYTNVPVYDFAKGLVYFEKSVSERLKIGLVLPDKITISSVLANVLDNSSSMNIKLILYRISNSSTKAEILGTTKSGGATTSLQEINFGISAHLIDNSVYQYFLLAEITDSLNQPGKWQGVDLALKNVLINYQY